MEKRGAIPFLRSVLAYAMLLAALRAGAAGAVKGAALLPTLDERLAAITAFGSRAEGSAGEAAAFSYVARALREAGLSPEPSGFGDASEGYSTSRIVEALVRGERADELALIVPLGSWIDSPEPSEGAYGVALALDEAARLSAEREAGNACPVSVRFVFLGAEKRGAFKDGRSASLGTRTWIARQEGRARLAVLYLSVGEPPTRMEMRSAGKGVLSPYWYYEGARRALESSGIGFDLGADRMQAYRLGLLSDYGPSAPYLEAGIPAIELRGLGSSPSTDAADPARTWLGAFVRKFASEEAGGFAESWDRHYFILQIGRINAAFREKSYVAFLVAFVALVASSFLVATITRRRDAKLLLRRAPVVTAEVLALYCALALVFLVGKGIALLDAAVLGSSEAWRLAPGLFAGSRVAFSILLFLSILSFLVEKRALTPNPYFYEFAALLCLAVDVLLFSAVDLSASFYFMWALIMVEISLLLRRRWATLIAYLLMYVPLIAVAGELAARPEPASFQRLISPDYASLLALSALTLPLFVFTASPLLFFARSGAAARKRAAVFFAACALAVEAASLAYAWASSPISGPGRKDISVSETIDQDAGQFDVEVAGLRRLGKGSVVRGGLRLDYDSAGDRAYLAGPDPARRIRFGERASPFLDRVDEGIRLGFEAAPYEVALSLSSPDEILIYDCSLPYKVAVDGKSAVIYPGVNPGEALDFSLTVPASFRAELVVEARYLASLVPYSQSSGAALIDAGQKIRASFEIRAGGG